MQVHAGLVLSAWLCLGCCAPAQSPSPTFTTVYSFPACAGTAPCIGVGPDSIAIGFSGVLYGTTLSGGTYGGGTVFSLTPPSAPGGSWTEGVLYNLGSDTEDWSGPAGLAVGNGGVLYGRTFHGGINSNCYPEPETAPDCGAVFSLTPPTAPGGPWTDALVFQAKGLTPSSLAIGGSGILYEIASGVGSCQTNFPGTLPACSSSAGSSLYSLIPPSTPTAAWTATLLYAFPATVGGYSNVVLGSGGLPYVATSTATGSPAGQILSFSPPGTGGNNPWIPAVLYNFAGAQPNWLAVGPGGALFGTAIGGVSSSGTQTYGSVWSLGPPTSAGGAWTANTLYTITDASVGTPNQILAIGPDGTIYISGSSTTHCGNTYCGTLFSLAPPTTLMGDWKETTLHNFTGGSDGSGVSAAAVAGDGVLYGTTPDGGTGRLGSVFSLSLAAPLPSINPGGLVNAASYTAPVAPGSIASVFGNFYVRAPLSAAEPPLPAGLAGLSIAFNGGVPAPLFFVSGGQINFQVPWELFSELPATIAVTLYGDTGPSQTINLAPVAPAIFTVDGSGSGQGAILDASNRLVDASNPATPASTVLQIFCTGLGPVTNQPPTGSPAPLSPLARTSYSLPPAVMIGGVAADVSFSGLAPGYVGLYQINARVPLGLPANNATPVWISYPLAAGSSNVVTIAVE